VLEVGVELDWIPDSPPTREGPLRLLWNHRWEHDKDPVSFLAAVDDLAEAGLDFEVVVAGENFRQYPAEFETAALRHPERIVHMGHLPVGDYRRHLLEADVVVSTALHEFFGVAVVEAVAAGCLPVLPDRLSYPTLIPPDWHATCLYPPAGLVDRLGWAITHPGEVRKAGAEIAGAMHRFGWEQMAPRYRRALSALATREDS
jgi:glycosyltransferase involved in cell wall biosynthesis